MTLDRDEILVENLRASLDLYQRSLVWAMTASAAFFVLTLSLGDPARPTVSVLYGQLSGPAAWFIALALFFVLGILAGSALQNAAAVMSKMRVPRDVLEATLLYPSLATSANGLIRIGTVLCCPIAVWIAFGLEIRREATPGVERGLEWWGGLVMFGLITAAPYAAIATLIWNPLGSRTSRRLTATEEPLIR